MSQSLNLHVPGKLLPSSVQRGISFGQDLTKYMHNQSNVQANANNSVGLPLEQEVNSQELLSSDVVPNEEAQEQDCQEPEKALSRDTITLEQ